MNPEQFATLHCPYCGEPNEVLVELAVGDQDYVEDCQVCCRPIELSLRVGEDGWSLGVRRDDE